MNGSHVEPVTSVNEVTQPQLRRGLSALGATTLVAGAVIGSGIYLSPSIVARHTGTPGLSLAVWLLCGGLALCGALCFAELGAAIPRTGGTYAFLQRAFRVRWLPFLFGWSMFAVVLTGVMAAVATAFATYAGHFLSAYISYGVWTQRFVAAADLHSHDDVRQSRDDQRADRRGSG